MSDTPSRWLARIGYRTANGTVQTAYAFEEIYELHDIVEHGPDWHAIEFLHVELVRKVELNVVIDNLEARRLQRRAQALSFDE